MKILSILLLFPQPLSAQVTLGGAAVNGTIADNTGAIVPAAKVTLTETARGLVRETESNEAGRFVFPTISAGAGRGRHADVPGVDGVCGVPAEAKAYSMNATVVPSGPLPYLTVWPTGVTQPVVSTLNSFDGTVVANALLAPGGYTGAIQAYVPSQTHLILDLNGFFVP